MKPFLYELVECSPGALFRGVHHRLAHNNSSFDILEAVHSIPLSVFIGFPAEVCLSGLLPCPVYPVGQIP